MNPDFLLAPSPMKTNPKVNVSTNTVLLSFAVLGAAGAFVWWQTKTKREAEEAAEVAASELEEVQAQLAWEEEEEARPGEQGRPATLEVLKALSWWAKQWFWGKRGLEVTSASWVWETHRESLLDGGKVRLVKGKDRIFSVEPKQGGAKHRLALKANGQIIELAL